VKKGDLEKIIITNEAVITDLRAEVVSLKR
jgi:hypothetical protein